MAMNELNLRFPETLIGRNPVAFKARSSIKMMDLPLKRNYSAKNRISLVPI